MGISGNNTPNRLTYTEPRPNYEVLSGEVVEETAPAVELTRRLVLAWLDGLRDLRNPALAPFYAETPRSRVSSQDADTRYAEITELADLLNVPPASRAEFEHLFLPSAAPTVFVNTLLDLGIELNFNDDFQQLDNTVLEYKNPVQPTLTGLQETTTRSVNPANIAALLDEIEQPSLVETTQHFADDYRENNAIDADAKAHARIFETFTAYVTKLLLLLP